MKWASSCADRTSKIDQCCVQLVSSKCVFSVCWLFSGFLHCLGLSRGTIVIIFPNNIASCLSCLVFQPALLGMSPGIFPYFSMRFLRLLQWSNARPWSRSGVGRLRAAGTLPHWGEVFQFRRHGRLQRHRAGAADGGWKGLGRSSEGRMIFC